MADTLRCSVTSIRFWSASARCALSLASASLRAAACTAAFICVSASAASLARICDRLRPPGVMTAFDDDDDDLACFIAVASLLGDFAGSAHLSADAVGAAALASQGAVCIGLILGVASEAAGSGAGTALASGVVTAGPSCPYGYRAGESGVGSTILNNLPFGPTAGGNKG